MRCLFVPGTTRLRGRYIFYIFCVTSVLLLLCLCPSGRAGPLPINSNKFIPSLRYRSNTQGALLQSERFGAEGEVWVICNDSVCSRDISTTERRIRCCCSRCRLNRTGRVGLFPLCALHECESSIFSIPMCCRYSYLGNCCGIIVILSEYWAALSLSNE